MQCPVCKNDKFNVTEVGDETVLICTRCGEDMLYCEDDEDDEDLMDDLNPFNWIDIIE